MPSLAGTPIIRVKKIPIEWTPDLSIFASEAYLRSISADYGWIGGKDEFGTLRCILPYTAKNYHFVRLVRLMTNTIPVGADLGLAEEKAFLESTVDYFRSIRKDMIIPPTANAIFGVYPSGSKVAPYGTYILDLNEPEENLHHKISEDYRKNIRRASKAGVSIASGRENLEEPYRLIVETLRRSSLGFRTYRAFSQLVANMGENIVVLTARYEGRIQACLIVPYSADGAYSLFSGTADQSVKGAMHLLQWEAIRLMKARGVKCFNFMGSRVNPRVGTKQEGIKNFKMRFGGTFFQGFIWKYPINKLKSLTYSAGVRILQGGDVVDQESKGSH